MLEFNPVNFRRCETRADEEQAIAEVLSGSKLLFSLGDISLTEATQKFFFMALGGSSFPLPDLVFDLANTGDQAAKMLIYRHAERELNDAKHSEFCDSYYDSYQAEDRSAIYLEDTEDLAIADIDTALAILDESIFKIGGAIALSSLADETRQQG